MEVFLDCLPCVLRQVLEAARLATDRPEVHEEIMQKATKLISGYRKFPDSPTFLWGDAPNYRTLPVLPWTSTGSKEEKYPHALQVYPFSGSFLTRKRTAIGL